MLYIILFIQYNGLEHTESDDKMVKEYLKEKADSLTAEKERLTAQKERLDEIREHLHKSKKRKTLILKFFRRGQICVCLRRC